MSKNKEFTTIKDIIQENKKYNTKEYNTYDSLNLSDRIKYLTIYVNKNKILNYNQHEAVLKMTDEEFFNFIGT